MPLMTSISPTFFCRTYTQRLASAMRIDEFDGNELIVENRVGCCDAQWVFEDGLDRPPHIDDLEAAFEESLGFIGEVVGHPFRGSRIGLIDVYSLDWASEGLRDWDGDRPLAYILGWRFGLSRYGLDAGVDGLATDSVIEDEYFGCTGALASRQLMLKICGQSTYAFFKSSSVSR